MYGWEFLAYFTCAFAAEFCFVNYVYGRDEHQKCNHSRVNIELSWDWSSDGNHFLGSMLSLSEKALMTNSWWIILIPGIVLVITLLCITELGEALRKNVNQKEGNL